jgi:hypothetical protein
MTTAMSPKKRGAAASRTRPSRGRPLRISLSAELGERLAAQAVKHNLEPAAAARAFLEEHVRELEETEQLSRAEEWQRAQAWATWEKIQAGDQRDVPMEQFREHTARALAEVAARTGRR